MKMRGIRAGVLRAVCCAVALCALLSVLRNAAAEETDVLSGSLPMLVNKDNPVDEDFLPADLVLLTDVLDSSLVRVKNKDTKAVRAAAEALETMLEAARDDGVKNWQINTAYRSISEQETLLNQKIRAYRKEHSGWSKARARAAALRTVAEPGCSEHHLGLAFDITAKGASAFKGTKQCKWLHAHCWEYGFIVRYQEGKEDITGFTAEEWHIRYVGKEHSLIMLENNFCLEEYLEGRTEEEDLTGFLVEDTEEDLDFEDLLRNN